MLKQLNCNQIDLFVHLRGGCWMGWKFGGPVGGPRRGVLHSWVVASPRKIGSEGQTFFSFLFCMKQYRPSWAIWESIYWLHSGRKEYCLWLFQNFAYYMHVNACKYELLRYLSNALKGAGQPSWICQTFVFLILCHFGKSLEYFNWFVLGSFIQI